jgi:hypothetical protein
MHVPRVSDINTRCYRVISRSFRDIVSTPGAQGDNVEAICEPGSPITLGVPVTVPLESMTPASAVGFPSYSHRKERRRSRQIRTGNALTED